MKTELTIGQSQRLIELGVDADKASAMDDKRTIIDGYPIFVPGYNPIFTLADLLGILPKKIEAKIQNVRRIVQLEVRWYGDCWLVRYSDIHDDIINDKTNPKLAYELIDALYDMLVWCIENKYLTTNQIKQ